MRTRTGVVVGIATAVVGLLCLGAAVAAITTVFSRPEDVAEVEVIGSWRGADGGSLTVREDHTFTAVDIPVHRASPERFRSPWTGEGTWRLIGRGPGSAQHLSTNLDGYGMPFYVAKTDDGVRLQLRGPSELDEPYPLMRQ